MTNPTAPADPPTSNQQDRPTQKAYLEPNRLSAVDYEVLNRIWWSYEEIRLKGPDW